MPEARLQACRTISRDDILSLVNSTPRRKKPSVNPFVYDFGKLGAAKFSDQKISSATVLFEAETGLRTISGRYGQWLQLNEPEQVRLAKEWQVKYADFVFVRDLLDISMCLDFNINPSARRHTELGSAEARAKNGHEESIRDLITSLEEFISLCPSYLGATAVCSVPPSPDKDFDLPTRLAQGVCRELGLTNISDSVHFRCNKRPIKSLSVEEKIDELERVGLIVDRRLDGEVVLLIDDKYQSGVTMNFVANELYRVGAAKVLGLCVVKTLRNDDNL